MLSLSLPTACMYSCTHTFYMHACTPVQCLTCTCTCYLHVYSVHVHVYNYIPNIIVCMYMYTAEHVSDDEEMSIPELPTISDNFVTPPTQRRMAPPSTLPTDLKSHPHPPRTTAPSSSQQPSSSGSGGGTRLSVGSSDRPEATSPRTQRNKWASVTSNSFDLSGDEGSTPAVFGKAV
jgi:hypothetical protein